MRVYKNFYLNLLEILNNKFNMLLIFFYFIITIKFFFNLNIKIFTIKKFI